MPLPLSGSAGSQSSTLEKKLKLIVEGSASPLTGMSQMQRAFQQLVDVNDKQLPRAMANAQRASESSIRASEALAQKQIQLAQARVNRTKAYADKERAIEQGLAFDKVKAFERVEQRHAQMIARLEQQEAQYARRAATSTATLGTANAAVGSAQSSMRNQYLMSGVSAAGTGFLGAGTLLLGGGAYLGSQGMKWQTAGGQLYANTGISKANLAAMQQFALNLARTSGGSPYDILGMLKVGMNMGFGLNRSEQVTQTALQSALPTGANPTTVMTSLSTGLNAFPGMKSNPMGAMDILHAVAQSSNMDVGDLAGAAAPALAVAARFGPREYQVALAAIGALVRQGWPVQDAVTQIKDLYLQLVRKPGRDRTAALAALKRAGYDLTGDFTYQGVQQKTLFGVMQDLSRVNPDPTLMNMLIQNQRGGVGAASLMGAGGMANFSAIMNNASNSQGVTAASYKNYLGLDSTQLKILEQNLHTTAITLGVELLPAINTLLKDAEPLVNDFAAWSKQNKGLIEDLVKMSPLLIGVGLGLKTIVGLGRSYLVLKEVGAALGGIKAAQGVEGTLAGAAGGLNAVKAASTGLIGGEAVAADTGAIGAMAGGEAGGASLAALGALGPVGLAAVGVVGLGLAAVVLYNKWSGFHGFVDTVVADMGRIAGAANQAAQNTSAINVANPTPAHTGRPGQHGGSYTTIAGWQTGNANAPGSYSSPGLHKTLSTPFGNYHSASSNRVSGGDAQMLSALGVGYSGDIYDTDYPTGGAKSNDVVLPGGPNTKWKLVKAAAPNSDWLSKDVGGYEVWQAPNGGIVTFLHLSKDQIYGSRNVKNSGGGRFGSVGWTQQTGWYTPRSGETVPGGTVVGLSGHPLTQAYGNDPSFYHLCVVTDAKGRQYVGYLTSGQMQQIQRSGGQVKTLPNAGGASKMSAGIRSDWGDFAGAGNQYGVNPYILAAVDTQESGGNPANMGMPSSYVGAHAQVYGAAATLRNWYNWTGTPAGKASMKAHGYNPNDSNVRWSVALDIYNNGPNNWWDSSPRPGESPGQYAHGPAYGNAVMGFFGGFTGQTSGVNIQGKPQSNAHQVTAQQLGLTNSGTQGAKGVDTAGVSAALDRIINRYHARNPDGSINFSKLPRNARSDADALIRLLAKGDYTSLGNTLNQDVSRGYMSQPTATGLWWGAYHQDHPGEINPEQWFNSQHASKVKAKGPSYWSSWWTGQKSKLQHNLDVIIGSNPAFTNPDGTVNFGAMPAGLRKYVDWLIGQIAKDQYYVTQADARASLPASAQGPVLSAAGATMRQWWNNPEGMFNAGNAGGAASTAGRVTLPYQTGSCPEVGRQNKIHQATSHHTASTAKHSQKTAVHTHTIATQAKHQSKRQDEMVVELKRVHQDLLDLRDDFQHANAKSRMPGHPAQPGGAHTSRVPGHS